MSTQIKKNGNWVTVAGGTRMWVGTKAALQAALDAGELVDGTAVMVTDDYEEAYRPHPDWANAQVISALPFTAPKEGIACITFNVSSQQTQVSIVVNGDVVYNPYIYSGSQSFTIPLDVGDVVSYTGNATVLTKKFVPWK